EELPAVFCYPKQWNGTTVLWLSGRGKSALWAADGSLNGDVQKLLDAGATVLSADLFQQGEFREGGAPFTKTGRGHNPREAAAYSVGYNHTVFAQRAQDVLTLVQFIKAHERPSKRLHVVAVEGAGPWVAAARAVSGGAIDAAAIDTAGFRFGQVLNLHDPNFLPGGAKYGDLPGMLALAAPGKVWVAGEKAEGLPLAKAQYQAANATANLVVLEGSGLDAIRAALPALARSGD